MPPPIEGIVETVLYVEDLPRAIAFYRDELGLAPLTGEPGRLQCFQAGLRQVLLLFQRGATLEPATLPGGVIPAHDGNGPQHLGFAVSAASYEAWRDWLQSRGIGIESEVSWPRGGRSLYFRDPDQHALELVTPGIWPNY